MWNRDGNPNKTSQIWVVTALLLLMSLNTLTVSVGVVAGDVRCLPDRQFQLLLMASLWLRMPDPEYLHNGGVKAFEKKKLAKIQIKCILPKLCHLPQYSHESGDPTTRVLGFPSYPGLGTRDLFSYHPGRWHSVTTHTQSVYQVSGVYEQE